MKARGWLLAALGLLLFNAARAQEREGTLWELEIEGNQAVSTSEIEDAIQTTVSSHIPVIGPKRRFDSAQFSEDLRRIEHLYRRRGYYQAVVRSADAWPCGNNKVCARIRVEEGEPTRVSRIDLRIQGGAAALRADLLRSFGFAEGQVFDHDRYVAGKRALIEALKARSYPLPEVRGEVVYDELGNRVAVNLEARPGTPARIGLITFEGLEHILPEDAMSRLPIRTGDWYKPSRFEEAQILLGKLDVFRTIEVELRPRAEDPAIADVVYRVREKPLKTLQVGFGFSIENSRQEARIKGQWQDRNFYHHLRRFTVFGEPRYAVLPSVFRPEQSGPLANFEVSYLHPAFLSPYQDLRTAVGFDSDLEQGYAWYGPRVNGNLSRLLLDRLTVGGGYSFRYLRFYNVNFAPGSQLSGVPPALLFTRQYRLGFFDQSVTWDGRDNRIEPKKGVFFRFLVEESAPVFASAFTYARFQPELRGYLAQGAPGNRVGTLAARALYGTLAPLAGSGSPVTERFYGGGANSHRGFAYHRLSPQVTAADGRMVPIGGDVTVEFSLEERMPLFLLGSQWLIGAVFLDAGDVVDSPPSLDLKLLHYAAGPGLRYDTPLGVIRADVGFRLNRLSDETQGRVNPDPGSLFAIHVSLGEAF